jgi:hypothetical protein
MNLWLDAGALIAFERGSAVVQAFVERAQRTGTPVRTTTAVIAQVFRKPSVQTIVVRLLRGLDELSLDGENSRRTGILLGVAKRADVVDGSLIDAARNGDEILTSDVSDLLHLANAAQKRLRITPV